MRRRKVGVMALVAWLGATLPAGAAMTTEEQLRALENLVNQQQKEIQQLRKELGQRKPSAKGKGAPAPAAVAEPAEPEAAPTTDTAAKPADKGKEAEKKTASLPEWVNKFTPFGDIRIRQEGFYNQQKPEEGGSGVTARNRTRYRWRLGLKYVYSEELGATVRLASGNPDDPISTNQTFEGNFSRKDVNLDWAYLTVAPGKTFGWRPGILTVNAGKFPNPMFRVGEMVFDEDLSPEGFNETVQLLGEPIGGLDQIKLHAQQWSFEETSNSEDGWMLGGQVNPVGHVGDVQLEGGLGHYWWLNPDTIATSMNSNSTLRGLNTNLLTFDDEGDITGYRSSFNQTNVTVSATLMNVCGTSMPLKFFADFVHNWEATNDHGSGVSGGLRFGNPKEKGDFAAGLLYEYLQQEAVLSTFSWSDFGNGGTNQQGPVLQLDYQLFKPLTLTARSYFTKQLDPAPGIDNRVQVRMQLDAQLRF